MPAFAQSTFTALFSGTGIESTVDDIVKDIEASWREIIYMCLVALGKLWVFSRNFGRCQCYKQVTRFRVNSVFNANEFDASMYMG